MLTVRNDDTIWVNGSSAGGNAVLSVSQGITNDGTILLESSNSTYASDIATGSNTLTNVGTIKVSLGSGGQRQVSGAVNDQGTVTADANASGYISGTLDNTGSIAVDPSAAFYVTGTYETR